MLTGLCPWTMPVTLHIPVPLHFLCSLQIDPISLYKSIKINYWNFYVQYYWRICTSNKYALKSHIYAICKKIDVHQWGKYANTYAMYELTGINHVTRSSVHRWWWQWWWCHSWITYTQSAGHLAKSAKNWRFSMDQRSDSWVLWSCICRYLLHCLLKKLGWRHSCFWM